MYNYCIYVMMNDKDFACNVTGATLTEALNKVKTLLNVDELDYSIKFVQEVNFNE